MSNKFLLPSLLLMMSNAIVAQSYITHVTVVDVEKKKLIADQTVIISNDIIAKVEASGKVEIPADAAVVDGTGKYLIPGLTDAHIHFFQNGGLYTRPDAIDLRVVQPHQKEMALAHTNMESVLRRYTQNGITNVVDIGASNAFLTQRDTFRNKDYAPSIFMSGPLLTTYLPPVFENLGDEGPLTLVNTIEEGRSMVREQLTHHPDFIKIWYIVRNDGFGLEAVARRHLPIIKAIIEEAHNHNLKVAVHATQRITAQLAVENGCDILVHSVDDEIVSDEFVQLLKKNKIILSPTLVVHAGYVKTFAQTIQFSDHDLRKADPFQLGTLMDLKHLPDTSMINAYKRHSSAPEAVARLSRVDSISLVNLKKLADAGVTIATGTDAGNIGTLHASSYLAEIKAMQQSGMSNWQILEASTIHGARMVDKEHEFGTVTEGKKANLVLLDANPVDDIGNVTSINRVINRGIVFDPATLIKETPVALVQRQLNGYNARSIEAFLEPYDEAIEGYTFPEKLIFKGKEMMRGIYSDWFDKTPNLHCALKGRMVQGNVVMDQEHVQIDEKTHDVIVIYQIANDKIVKVYFVQ